jgi:hypothetical protein
MNNRFEVRTVSSQINGNHLAWSKIEASAETREEAEAIANDIWREMCDEAGTNFIREVVFVHDTEE